MSLSHAVDFLNANYYTSHNPILSPREREAYTVSVKVGPLKEFPAGSPGPLERNYSRSYYVKTFNKKGNIKEIGMSALEQVLKGYGCFKEGDIEGLAALCHEDMTFKMNGTHSLSGEYHGFGNWLNNFLAKIPTVIPGFHLEMEHCFESGNDVFCHLRATGEGLDGYFGHYFVVEDGKIRSFHAFDDSQQWAKALGE